MEIWLNGSKQAIIPQLSVSVMLLIEAGRVDKTSPRGFIKAWTLQQMQSVSPISHHREFKKSFKCCCFCSYHMDVSTASTLEKQKGWLPINCLHVHKNYHPTSSWLSWLTSRLGFNRHAHCFLCVLHPAQAVYNWVLVKEKQFHSVVFCSAVKKKIN